MSSSNCRVFVCVAVAFIFSLLFAGAGRAQSTPAAPKPYLPQQWEKEIAAFEQADKKQFPAPGGIVFVGSSSIRVWKTLADDFPGVPVLNRGFGGSRIADSTYFADRIVIPYKPRMIVFYAGDNDLWAGLTPQQVFADYRRFVVTVRRALPDVHIVYISIKPSPSRWKLRDAMQETNARIREWGQSIPNHVYADVWTPMLASDGQPRPELFLGDQLHMKPEGYAIWKTVIAPLLTP